MKGVFYDKMKKLFNVLLIFVLTFVFTFGVNSVPILDQLVPQPVYRIPLGIEIEEIMNTAEELLYIYEQLQNLKKQLVKFEDQEYLLRALIGNEKILELLDADFSDMDLEEWYRFLTLAYEIFFPKKNTVVEITKIEPSKEVVEVFETTSDIISGVANLVTDESDFSDEIYTGNLSPEQKKAVQAERQLKNLQKRYELLDKKYNDLLIKYNDYVIDNKGEVVKVDTRDSSSSRIKAPENSMVKYISEKESELKEIEENLNQYGSTATIPVLLNIQNKLLIQSNDINLKILMALTDLNAQNALDGISDNVTKIIEAYIDYKHKELR